MRYTLTDGTQVRTNPDGYIVWMSDWDSELLRNNSGEITRKHYPYDTEYYVTAIKNGTYDVSDFNASNAHHV